MYNEKFMITLKEMADYLCYVANVRGFLPPKEIIREREFESLFYVLLNKERPELVTLATTAGLTPKEFYEIERTCHCLDTDTYMQKTVEIIESAFNKQRETRNKLFFMGKTLESLGTFTMLSHTMHEQQRASNTKIQNNIVSLIPPPSEEWAVDVDSFSKHFQSERTKQDEEAYDPFNSRHFPFQIEIGTGIEDNDVELVQ